MQNLAQEQFRPLAFGAFEEFPGGILLDDLALIHENYPVSHLPGKSHFVGDAQHGHAALGQINHDLENFLDHLRVQR